MFKLSVLYLAVVALVISCGQGLGSEPPLHDAAYRGNVEKVRELVSSGIPVDSLNSEGATPLHWAAFKGHEDVARILLNSGADVNARTKKGSTPLRLATTHKQERLIQLLKGRGGEL